MTTNDVLNVFKKFYPDLTPTKIFSVPNGYLIIAPQEKEDYGDPNYFVDSKLTKATAFDMRKIDQMFKAFDRGPIWEKK